LDPRKSLVFFGTLLVNSRPVTRTGPEVPQEALPLPVPPPAPRPVINFATNFCSLIELAEKTRIWEGERSSGARRNGWSHMEE
jgi:hypothetical protein